MVKMGLDTRVFQRPGNHFIFLFLTLKFIGGEKTIEHNQNNTQTQFKNI